jgi:hypothetical protein
VRCRTFFRSERNPAPFGAKLRFFLIDSGAAAFYIIHLNSAPSPGANEVFAMYYSRPIWQQLLLANALGSGHAAQLEALPETFLDHLYHHQVAPTVASVIAFCQSDPERWLDRREYPEAAAKNSPAPGQTRPAPAVRASP